MKKMIASIVIYAIIAAMAIASPFISNAMNKKNNQEMLDYNSPVNQVERLDEAGLNPNLAAGGFNTITQTPQMSNPAESLIDGLGGISQAYNSFEGIKLRKASTRQRDKQLELNELKLDIQKRVAEQALQAGDLDLALKALNYDTAIQTQPAEIQRAFANAGIAGNKWQMSSIDAASYETYRDYVVSNEFKKGQKMDAEYDYLTNVKPQIEWFKANTQRMSVEDIISYHKDMVDLAKTRLDSMDAQQKRQYDLAVKNYNLAVRKQKWDEAHYWINVGIDALGGVAHTAGRMYGIPVR